MIRTFASLHRVLRTLLILSRVWTAIVMSPRGNGTGPAKLAGTSKRVRDHLLLDGFFRLAHESHPFLPFWFDHLGGGLSLRAPHFLQRTGQVRSALFISSAVKKKRRFAKLVRIFEAESEASQDKMKDSSKKN